jgi:hypothetical protein
MSSDRSRRARLVVVWKQPADVMKKAAAEAKPPGENRMAG